MSKYADYNNIPLSYIKNKDISNGVEPLNENNLRIQDIYKTPFLFLNEHHKNYKEILPNILYNNVCDDDPSNKNYVYKCNNKSTLKINNLYFSKDNTRRLQNLIKREIFIRTNKKFKLDADQDEKELFLSMRAIFIEHAILNSPTPVREVKRLNKLLVDSTVPGMLTHILQYYGYLKDINQPRELLNRPINVNNAGRQTLPSVTQVFF